MLSDMIIEAIASEPDMMIVTGNDSETNEIDAFLHNRRIDVIIFGAGNSRFLDTEIARLLHENPRLGLLAIDGAADRGTLHHLVPVRDEIGRLDQSSVVGGIRAGASLRRH